MSDEKVITEYYLISDPCENSTQTRVNRLITMGWEPFGSLIVVPDKDGDPLFVRELVKYGVPPCDHSWIAYHNKDGSLASMACSICAEEKPIDESVNNE